MNMTQYGLYERKTFEMGDLVVLTEYGRRYYAEDNRGNLAFGRIVAVEEPYLDSGEGNDTYKVEFLELTSHPGAPVAFTDYYSSGSLSRVRPSEEEVAETIASIQQAVR